MAGIPLTLIIMVVWIALVFIIGILAGVLFPIKKFEDWATAGRSLKWLVNYFTAHATQFSALQYMGFFAFIYMFGISAYYSIYIMYMLTTCAFLVLFSPRIWRLGKRFGHITPADLLSQYYGGGKWFSVIIGIILLLGLLPYLQVQVMAGGYLFQLASGGLISFWTGAAILYGLVVVYTWVGGFRAVAWTDAVQGALLLLGIFFGAILITQNVGGGFSKVVSTMVQENPQFMYVSGLRGWDYRYVLSLGIVMGFGWAFHAHMWLRNYSPKSERDARTWPCMVFVIGIITGIVLLMAGMALIVAFPGQAEKADVIFLKALGDTYPGFLYGLVLAGAASAMLSSVDSQVHAIGVVITKNFLIDAGKKLSDEQSILLNRLAVVVFMALGLIMAYIAPQYLAWIAGYAASLGMLLAPSVICALTAQRWATRYGVVAGILGGAVVIFATSMGPLKNACNIYFGFWGTLANVIILVIVSWLTKKAAPSEEVVRAVRETPL